MHVLEVRSASPTSEGCARATVLARRCHRWPKLRLEGAGRFKARVERDGRLS